MPELGLAQAIQQLRREVTIAATNAKGEPLQFTLGAIELELEVELVMGAEAKAEAKWVVVSFGGSAKLDRTRAHRVKLTLTPQADGESVNVSRRRQRRPG